MPDKSVTPGTYRIVSGLAGTAIQISDRDNTKIVTWERHQGDNQHWFVQRSGDGYTFKNRRYGSYIAVTGTEDMVPLRASKYPMTWELLELNDCHGIQFPGNSLRVFDLHNALATNGNIIHLWGIDDHRNKTWKFEHLSDETEETTTERSSCTGRDPRIVDQGEKPVKRRADISERDEVLGQMEDQMSLEQELSEQRALASQREATICQLQEIIKVKDEALAHAYKSNEEIAYLRDQQTQLQIKLLQSEMAGLHAKVDRLGYPKSQMMNKDEGSTYHGTYGGA